MTGLDPVTQTSFQDWLKASKVQQRHSLFNIRSAAKLVHRLKAGDGESGEIAKLAPMAKIPAKTERELGSASEAIIGLWVIYENRDLPKHGCF